MSGTYSGDQAYKYIFDPVFYRLSNIEKSVIKQTFTPVAGVGDSMSFQRIKQDTKHVKKTDLNEVVKPNNATHDRFWLFHDTYYDNITLDKESVRRMAQDPASEYFQILMGSAMRIQDEVALDAFFATVTFGKLGTDTTSGTFPAANYVAKAFSGGAFGQTGSQLTIDKLLEVKKKASAKRVKYGRSAPFFVLVREKDIQDMLANKIGTDNFPIIHQDFVESYNLSKTQQPSEFGDSFMWNDFVFIKVPDEYLPTDSSGDTLIPVYQKQGMLFGTWINVESDVVRLPNTLESMDIRVLTDVGAVRRDPDKVYGVTVTT